MPRALRWSGMLTLIGMAFGFLVLILGWIVLAELALLATVVSVGGFLTLWIRPARWRDDPLIGWHVAAFSAASAVEALLWLLAAKRLHVQVWMFAVAFLLVAAASTWRLVLEIRARLYARQMRNAVASDADDAGLHRGRG